MADASRKFEIRISTVNDGAGAAQAAQGLDNVGKSGARASEDLEKLNFHSRETHRLFGELDRLAPTLGEALHAAFDPEFIPILVLISGVTLLLNALQRTKETAKEVKNELDEMTKADITGWADALGAADTAANQYRGTLGGIKEAIEDIKTAETQHTAILNAQAEAAQKILDAREKMALAEAAGDKIKETQIREQFGELKGRAAIDAERAAITDEQAALASLPSAGDLASKVAGAKARSQADEQALKRQLPGLEARKQFLEGFTTQLDEQFSAASPGEQKEQAQADLDAAIADLAATTKKISDLQQNAANDKQAFDDLTTAVKARATAEAEYTKKINEAMGVLEIHITTQRRIHDIISAGSVPPRWAGGGG